MKIIFFGDIVGKPGRQALAKILPGLKKELNADLVIANIENLAHGKGVTLSTVQELCDAGVDFFTSGNHIFRKPEYTKVFEQFGEKIIRPANFAPEFPGDGYKVLEIKGVRVMIANLLGEVFMEKQVDQGPLTSPFHKLNEILGELDADVKVKLLDFHAEATSEKRSMGFWADGRLSAVVGTHTHVPTADAQILPGGTGYVTDLGMTGAALSVIGVKSESALARFQEHDLEGKKVTLEIPEDVNKYEVSYTLLEIDEATGKCQNIVSKSIMNYE